MDSSTAWGAVNSNGRYGDRDLAGGLTPRHRFHPACGEPTHRTWVHRVTMDVLPSFIFPGPHRGGFCRGS